jgi:hypothetical protein
MTGIARTSLGHPPEDLDHDGQQHPRALVSRRCAGSTSHLGMCYAIACARAKVLRAVAIYEGAQLSGCEGGNDPIAYWQMAGTFTSL